MSSNKRIRDKQITSQSTDNDSRITRLLAEGALIGSVALCLIMVVALLTYSSQDPGWSTTGQSDEVANAVGPAGALFADIFYSWFGVMAYLFPVLLAFRALQILRTRFLQKALPFDMLTFNLRIVGFILVMIAATSLASIQFELSNSGYDHGYGGILGVQISTSILQIFSFTGSTVILLALLLFGLTVFADISWIAVIDRSGLVTINFFERLAALISDLNRRRQEKIVAKVAIAERTVKVEAAKKKQQERVPPTISTPDSKPKPSSRAEREKQQPLFIDEKVEGVLLSLIHI